MGATSTRLWFAVGAAAVLALTVTVSPATAQASEPDRVGRHVPYGHPVPGLAPSGVANDGQYLDENGRVIASHADDLKANPLPQAQLSSCTPISGRDNPHYSSGDVSGHGWWDKGTCSSNTAHVYNCLYEYYTDGTWRQKACSARQQLRPYHPYGDRTTARASCNYIGPYISWRNHVDVDADGQNDPPDRPYNQANVQCTVN